MATSGTATFEATRNEIVYAAARKINAIASGQTMGAQMLSDFTHALNAMVKRWQVQGIHIWTIDEATLFPQENQVRYEIGASGADHVCATYTDYERTTISAAEASGQTTLSITSGADIADSDNIGIGLDDGSIQWTTVSSHTSTTVTVATALTDSAAEGNPVYTYTTKIVRPLRIIEARRFNPETGDEVPISVFSRNQYMALSRKETAGTITALWYEPRRATSGFVYLWQPPSPVSDLVRFTYRKPLEDFSASSDNADLPQEWTDTLEFNLALVMAPEYNVAKPKFEQIAQMAAVFLAEVSGSDREPESLFVEPDMDG